MNLNEYQMLAARTIPLDRPKQAMLINGALGLAGESGEVCDLLKKYLHQGHPLDEEQLIYELGDVLWYIAEVASAMGVELDYVARWNLEKLRQRYPDGFSAERSINRG